MTNATVVGYGSTLSIQRVGKIARFASPLRGRTVVAADRRATLAELRYNRLRTIGLSLLFDFHLDVSSDDAHGETLHVPLRRRCQDRPGFYFESGTVPRADNLIVCQHPL